MNFTALRRWWPLAAVVALLAVAVMAAASSTPQLERIPEAGPADDDSPATPQAQATATAAVPTASAGAEATARLLPSWVPLLLGVLLLLLLAGVVAALLWGVFRALFGRRYGEPPPTADGADEPTVDAAEVVAAVEAGLDDLSDVDRDPRRAVIACWLRLEEAAQAAGVPRRPGDTSTDLVTRLLSGAGTGRVVSADVLAGFAEVYREARYATHTVDERMREHARAALARLRAELTGIPA